MQCIHISKIGAGIIDQHGNEKDAQVLFCKKKDIYLYPPMMEHRGFHYEMIDEKENLPMPKECEEQVMVYDSDPW